MFINPGHDWDETTWDIAAEMIFSCGPTTLGEKLCVRWCCIDPLSPPRLSEKSRLDTGNKTELDFLDLRTSRIRRIYTFDKPPEAWAGGLSVSPDGKWLVYSQVDEAARDLMLVENFR
jgi:hypothetical protein